jgi:C4-dicarboxylate transporter DctM subunit
MDSVAALNFARCTSGQLSGWRKHAHLAENVFLSLLFALLLLLPLLEIALRAIAGIGINGSATLTQHLTLVVGMFGAAVAAREDRLLGFSASQLFPARYAHRLKQCSYACAAGVAILLCIASVQFVDAERAGARALAYNFPLWIVQLVLPVGYALIALRLVARSAETWRGTIQAGILAAVLAAIVLFAPVATTDLLIPALTILLAAMLAGAPLFAVVGGAALILLLSSGVPIASVAVNHYSLTANPTLPAIPLFTLAGYFLAESGAPRRLIEVFDALFGQVRGGAAIVAVLALTFFTSFTGGSGVAIVALGGLAMPLLLSARYEKRTALGLVTGGGLPGVLLFPALPLILYAIVARTSIEEMFIGGLLPTLLMLGITLWWGLLHRPIRETTRRPLDGQRICQALWAAKWELAMPAVPIVILLGGFATPVEAAAATALYAFITATVIHRDIKVYPDAPRIITECGLLVGGILLILGVALALTNFLVDAQIPERAVEWVQSHIQSPWVFLLALNGLLLLVGCVMDIYCAIVVVTPLIVPLGLAFGVHPVHLGMIFLANMELGYLTPPIGLNLFYSSYRFDTPIPEVCRSVAPLFLALATGVLAITYVPWLSIGLIGIFR